MLLTNWQPNVTYLPCTAEVLQDKIEVCPVWYCRRRFTLFMTKEALENISDACRGHIHHGWCHPVNGSAYPMTQTYFYAGLISRLLYNRKFLQWIISGQFIIKFKCQKHQTKLTSWWSTIPTLLPITNQPIVSEFLKFTPRLRLIAAAAKGI